VLEFSRISEFYGSVGAVEDVDLIVPTGGRAAIVGRSGSGKTTLPRLIAGFEQPSAGDILLDRQVIANEIGGVPAHLRGIGYLPQDGGLFPHLSVASNIGFGIEARSTQRSKRVAELMEMVALDPGMGSRRPHELSGGQQQRVALARALSQRPRLMLLDEPFSALDTGLRAATRRAIGDLPARVGATTILVTHNQVEALSFSDQVAVIRDGRLVQVGSGTELYLRPKDDLTARFLGEAVLLPAQLAHHGMGVCVLGTIAVDDIGHEGRGHIMLRPEQLQIDRVDPADSEDVQWEVAQVDFEGFSSLITIRAIGTASADGPRSLTVRGLSARALELGAKIKITVIGGCSQDAFLSIAARIPQFYSLLTLSTTIWLAIPAFKRVPNEIEEAAFVDGYGPYAIFFLIALPIARKSLVGAIVFSFVLVWNEFLIALMLTTSDAKTPPVVASEMTQLGRDVPWGILTASVILLSPPPLLFLGVLSSFLRSALKTRNQG
jgi:iron(III) transport system ATP-binding protein